MRRLFTAHPEAVGETYGEHLVAATGFGLRLVLGGLACIVHAVLPFAFVTTASRTVRELHERMGKRGPAAAAPKGEASRA
jgi:hypothetical protein